MRITAPESLAGDTSLRMQPYIYAYITIAIRVPFGTMMIDSRPIHVIKKIDRVNIFVEHSSHCAEVVTIRSRVANVIRALVACDATIGTYRA